MKIGPPEAKYRLRKRPDGKPLLSVNTLYMVQIPIQSVHPFSQLSGRAYQRLFGQHLSGPTLHGGRDHRRCFNAPDYSLRSIQTITLCLSNLHSSGQYDFLGLPRSQSAIPRQKLRFQRHDDVLPPSLPLVSSSTSRLSYGRFSIEYGFEPSRYVIRSEGITISRSFISRNPGCDF